MTRLYLNLDGSGRGGPHVWAMRFKRKLEQRGFSVTHQLDHALSPALFVNETSKLHQALERDQVVGYRVAMGFLAPWFEKLGRRMQSEHHATNASIGYALDCASVVFYQSEWARAHLGTYIYQRSGPSAVILNGVDLTEFKPPTHRLQDPPVIGTVGLLRYHFRLATFFEMSRRLPIPHRLLVVGEMDDECAAELRKAQSDPLIKDRLTYRTFVPPEKLPLIYAQMSLLVHPVSGDICPNVVAEALACGVPVVAPRFGGTVELVGSAGVIFDSPPWTYDDNFVEAMSAAAKEALSNVEHLSRMARQRAEQHLDLERMVDRYLECLGLPERVPCSTAPGSGFSWRNRLRGTGAVWIRRSRYLAALALRKARRARSRVKPRQFNPRPRIAFTLFDFHVGGIENWLFRLATALHGEYEFYFLSTKVPEFLPKFRQTGTCAFLPDPARMITYLRRHNIDLVQVHNERWPVDAALAAGVPKVLERLGGQRSWRRVSKYGLDLVIASSQMAAKAIADLAPQKKIRLIYNGIDLAEADAARPIRLFPTHTFVVGRACRFGRRQNLGLLIEALARLRARWPAVRLVLVGGDSLVPGSQLVEAELRQLAHERQVSDLVAFTGVVEDPIPYIKGFDLGTCISNDEGLPNSLLEAMACSKPVVSTRVGAIPELIESGKNGLFIPAGDVEALCAAIQRFLEQPDLVRRLGAAGRCTIEERFALHAAAQKYAEVYRSLLASSS